MTTPRSVQVVHNDKVLAYGHLTGRAWRHFLATEFPPGSHIATTTGHQGHAHRYEVGRVLNLSDGRKTR